MGITGKLELWRSLEALDGGADIRGMDFAVLAARAEDQRDRVEDLRVRAAREALSGEVSRLARSHLVFVSGAANHHGEIGMVCDGGRDAPQERRADSSAPVRPENDDPGSGLLGGHEDGFPGAIVLVDRGAGRRTQPTSPARRPRLPSWSPPYRLPRSARRARWQRGRPQNGSASSGSYAATTTAFLGVRSSAAACSIACFAWSEPS